MYKPKEIRMLIIYVQTPRDLDAYRIVYVQTPRDLDAFHIVYEQTPRDLDGYRIVYVQAPRDLDAYHICVNPKRFGCLSYMCKPQEIWMFILYVQNPMKSPPIKVHADLYRKT